MPDIHHEIKVAAPRETVYEALTTRAGVGAWHATSAGGTGEVGTEWAFGFGDGPEFTWEITASVAPTTVAWTCTRGPGDSIGTTVTYTLTDAGGGRTLVEHVHAGWPGTHGNFRKCNTLWGVLLHQLRQYVETGHVATASE